MLIKLVDLQRIASGEITLAFRKWKRPTVRPGSTLKTAIGVLAIDSVEAASISKIGKEEAEQAGFASRAELIETLASLPENGEIYRISLRRLGDDPRISLRENASLTRDEIELLKEQLRRMDSSSRNGAWTERVLRAIAQSPAQRASDLARQLRLHKVWLKRNVRKLKELGLTESLAVGYQLSPRGRALVDRL